MRATLVFTAFVFLFLCLLFTSQQINAKNPYRSAFFDVYPLADGTQIAELNSTGTHCGVCHFDFGGSGTRNPYGLQVEAALESGNYGSTEEAIQSLENNDSDNDGYSNLVEITDLLNFSNTPTFPGLTSGNVGLVVNVDINDVIPFLTPSGATDTIPPVVMVVTPNGGESYDANTVNQVTWMATDASGISFVDIYLSDDNGLSFDPIAKGHDPDSPFDWFVHNYPGSQNIIRVIARDNAGNFGGDWSDGTFTINAVIGLAPTTLRDMILPGSQPHEAGIHEDPDATCVACHGNYDTSAEPWFNWRGSMMSQAMRDPLFLACMAVAEQDAPSVGDLCIRCHTPTGWLEGRSVDTSGGLLTEKDIKGIQCDFCHRAVDPIYKPGTSPAQDEAVLDSLETVPLSAANGQYVADADPYRRGPYTDALADHQFLYSPFHTKGDFCGTCHDVSNPVFLAGSTPAEYVLDAFDTPHPDGDRRNMFPVERTYSEWEVSQYAVSGVYAPEFAGTKPDGIVSTCQDCHMPDVAGKGAVGGPNRTDLPQHDLMGGNYFIPDILPDLFPGEVDVAQLQAAKQRAIDMLQKAATIALATDQNGLNPTLTVTITNETGHKLISGYPEGRRMWLNIRAWDAGNALVYESGAYDTPTGVLTKDEDIKVYEIKPGISTRLAPILGHPAAPSFHFVLNDTVYSDNRIPPRGFTNANFETAQSPVVAYTYADGQYWDDTTYELPENAVFAEVILNYQSVSKGYVEALRDDNFTNDAGQVFYDAWAAHGRCAPVAMVSDTTSLHIDVTGIGDVPSVRTALFQNYPNPFTGSTSIRYSLQTRQHVTIEVYDVAGRLVRTLVNDTRPAGAQTATWNRNNQYGQHVSSGIYFFRMQTADHMFVRKAVLLK